MSKIKSLLVSLTIPKLLPRLKLTQDMPPVVALKTEFYYHMDRQVDAGQMDLYVLYYKAQNILNLNLFIKFCMTSFYKGEVTHASSLFSFSHLSMSSLVQLDVPMFITTGAGNLLGDLALGGALGGK